MEPLKIDLEEREQYRILETLFLEINGPEKEAICKPFQGHGHFNLANYFKEGIVGSRERVQELNKVILDDIDSVLQTRARKKRFRELYTQFLLMEMDINTLIGLHDLRLTMDEYVSACKEAAKVHLPRGTQQFEYDVFLDFLVDQGHLTQEEVDKAAGEKFEGVISKYGRGKGPIFSPISHHVYQDVPIRMLVDGQIHAELELSVAQVEAARALHKNLLKKWSTPKAEAMLDKLGGQPGGQEKFLKEMEIWRREADKPIRDAVKPEQYRRLRQLFFQYNARRLRLNWCCYIAGREFDWENRMRMELVGIQIESDYYWQAQQMLAGYEILKDLVGEGRARSMVGRFELTPWVGAASDLELDRKIRKRLQGTLLGDINREIGSARRGRRANTD